MTAPIPHTDAFLLSVRALALNLSREAELLSPLSPPVEVRQVSLHAVVTISVSWRISPRLAVPDDCERAILELVYRKDRIRARELIELLADCWPSRTVERRLARLVRLGVLDCRREAPRGYALIAEGRSSHATAS